MGKAKALGINHVVLEVEDLDAALEFYGRIFDITARDRGDHNVFMDMGDQFIQLTLNKRDGAIDTKRHFGFVVDNRDGIRETLGEMGVEIIGDRLNFRDPWGNRIEVVAYDNVQFTKVEHVAKAMGVDGVQKSEEVLGDLAQKNMAPDQQA